jgi:hypothetical protein
VKFRDCHRTFLTFKPPSLLVSQIAPTAANFAGRPRLLLPGRTCFVASARTGYAIRPFQAIDGERTFTFPDVRSCRLLQGPTFIFCSARAFPRFLTQSDPCISSVTTPIMITTSNSPAKGSGIPNQYLGVLLHTMAMYGLSRVRTELFQLLVIPSLTPHPIQTNR